MATTETATGPGARRGKRADARRNEQALLDAAVAVYVRSGINAPVRDIAAEAGVGMGTLYRHFPSRADLIVAVFRHQVDSLADASSFAENATTPVDALRSWMHRFADFLVTKHGLAEALHSDQAGFERLHAEFVERLLPVCDELLRACTDGTQTPTAVGAYDLLRGIGNLCIGMDTAPDYNARALIDAMLRGVTTP